MTAQNITLSLKKRNIAALIFLSIATLGIYSIVWTCRLSRETRNAMEEAGLPCRDSEVQVAIYSILSFGTCWFYILGERIAALGRIADGDEREFPWGVVHLILVLTLWFPVSLILLQMEVNRLADSERLLKYIASRHDEHPMESGEVIIATCLTSGDGDDDM